MIKEHNRLLTITSNDLGISWGPAIHYLELWNEFSALADSPVIDGLAPSWTKTDPIVEPKFNLRLVKVPNVGKIRQVIYDFLVFFYLFIHGSKYDFLYVRASHWHILTILFLKISGKRFVIELNGLAKDDSVSSKKGRWMTRLICWQEKWFCENASDVICVSRGIENTVRRKYEVAGNAVTIRNGVAKQFFRSDEKSSGEIKKVIYVGTFTPWDGAEKIKDLAKRYTNIEFLLVGDGPGRSRVQNNSPKNMAFTGMVNYSELPSLYASADAAIVIYEFERHRNVELSSIKTLEYLASRLPVFSTDVPGQEMIKKRGFGYLVSEGESVSEAFGLFNSEYSNYSDALWAVETDELVGIIGWRKTAVETMGVLISL